MRKLSVKFSTKEYKRIFTKISVDKTSGCWNWNGARDYGGYGQGFYRGRKERVHRLIYAFYKGAIPRGKKMTLDHLCRNTSCCNPEHLELVAMKVNIIRGNGITAMNARKTHCKYGHELPPYNINVTTKRARAFCRVCDSIRHKKRMQGEQRQYWLEKSRESAKRWYAKHRKVVS